MKVVEGTAQKVKAHCTVMRPTPGSSAPMDKPHMAAHMSPYARGQGQTCWPASLTKSISRKFNK